MQQTMKIALIGPGIMPIPPPGWGAVEFFFCDYSVAYVTVVTSQMQAWRNATDAHTILYLPTNYVYLSYCLSSNSRLSCTGTPCLCTVNTVATFAAL
jgi:hypothetical protein